MKKIQEFIESGILEMYVLNNTSAEETEQVRQLAEVHPEIRKEIEEISDAFEVLSMQHAIMPSPTVKPFLMAIIDYTERMQNGEAPSFPPPLNEASRVEDYAEWLNREDLSVSTNADDVHAKIIGHTPEVITAIVWLKKMAPEEVHDNEYEKFLVVEGTCNIVIEEEVHSLVPGDYMKIPLHKIHRVEVTSQAPCKVILQRMAA